MKPTRPITRAFCVELQQELSIVAARREYFSQEPPRARFDFLCSSEACRAQGVKVTGVRYDVKPQDNPTFVAAHFRANPHYDHHTECEWVDDSDADADAELTPSSDPQLRLRQLKRKLDDAIDVFDPNPKEPVKEAATREQAGKPSEKPAPTGPVLPRMESATPRYSETRTNNLERLVDFYRQARAELSPEDFKQLTLRVAGQGEVTLRSYFRHIKFAQAGDKDRVMFGGGLVERYGVGFKFVFFDRIDGKRVSLYVSPARMQAYRSSRYLNELLSHAEHVKFFTVFALGNLLQSPSGKSLSVEIDDLRHLAIVLGPAKEALPAATE